MSDALKQHLAAALAQAPDLRLCVGFSGGPDSTTLLHALGELPAARARGLRALHVDHGMSPQSVTWAERCQRFCETLNVPCEVIRVQVELDKGLGLEAAARTRATRLSSRRCNRANICCSPTIATIRPRRYC